MIKINVDKRFLHLLRLLHPCLIPPLSRVRLSGMKIVRPPVAIGHYKMIKHKGDRGNEQNPRRYERQGAGGSLTHTGTHTHCDSLPL